MGLKIIIILVAVVLLALIGMTGGAFLDLILPNSQGVIGHGLCFSGGFIVNPLFDVSGIQIPLPQADDIIISLFITMPVLFYFFRGQSWKRILIIFFVFMVLILIGYKLLGLMLVGIAEQSYGMTDCINTISIGGLPIIQYSWFSPLFVLGFIFALIALFAGIIKLHRWKNSRGG